VRRGWGNPPPVVVVGGSEPYLRDREIRKAIRASASLGKDVVESKSGPEAEQTASYANTFGMPTLVVVSASDMKAEDVQKHIDRKSAVVTVLMIVDGDLDEKKYPAIVPVHGAHRAAFSQPKTRKAKLRAATVFAQSEADGFLQSKGVLPTRLADALVSAVGDDLGLIHNEVLKVCSLAKARGVSPISAELLRSTLYRPSGVDLTPLREAFASINPVLMMKALDRLKNGVPGDPVMLVLRARGAPGYLAIQWLQITSLLERGASEEEIAQRLQIPAWAVRNEVVAASKWGSDRLRKLVVALARVERAVFTGAPSPWVSCVATLVGFCANEPLRVSVGRRY
jgi:DNA polymerase III delta subunit